MDTHLPIPGITNDRRPQTAWWTILLREALVILAATVFLALTARISLRLPFSPVPVTGQTLGILLTGALLGPRRGTLAVLAYLAQGATGLPVFAGGTGGLAVFAGPTAGYLAGFVPAAAVAGFLGHTGRAFLTRLGGLVVASAVIYLFGTAGLMLLIGLPFDRAVAAGVLPFIAGDLFKIFVAIGVIPAGAPLIDAVLGRRTGTSL